MGSTFTGRLYLGSGAGDPSIYSVTGDPNLTPPPEIPNAGDLALSDNGTLYVYNGAAWDATGTGSGNVVGPGSATDNALARFDGTSGDLLQNSSAVLDDTGNLSLNAVPTVPVTYAPQLKLYDANFLAPEYVAIAASNTMSPGTSYSLALPPAAGAANEALTTDGSGNLIWQLPIFSGGSAGGSLTGTYPSPSIAAGAVGTTEIANGAVNIGQLAVNVTNNYLPSTTEKQAMTGTSGTPSATNAFLTQEGGTFTPISAGPAYSVTDPVSATTTYSQAADGTATLTPSAAATTALDIAPVAPGTSAFTVTDPTTSVTTVDQKPDGTVTYTDPAAPTANTAVTGGAITINNNSTTTGVTVNNNSTNNSITIAGDSTNYTYNAAPVNNAYFQYVLNQPISVNVSMLDTGVSQLSETDTTVLPNTTGRLALSAAGSSTAGTGVSISSLFDAGLGFNPAKLTLNASSLRFTGDLAPNNLPGTTGQVLVSQGAGVPPIWAASGAYAPATPSNWTTPTPPTPAGTGTAPTDTGGALDTLAAQNYARWLNLRTIRTDTNNSNVVVGLDQSISVILVDATAGNRTETLPAASALAGKYYTVKKIDSTANTVTVARAGSDLIDGQTSYVLGTRYSAITLVSNGTNWFTLDFQTTPGTAGQLLTSAGAGASPTWTSQSAFTAYAPATPSNWTTPTPVGPAPTTISGALDTLALQNYTRWVNYRTVEARSTSGNAILTDNSVSAILVDATAGARTITLPPVGTWTNKWLTVKKTDASANVVSVVGDGGALIDGAGTQSIAYQYDAITVVSNGTSWSILDRINSTPPTPVLSTVVSVALNGSASFGAPTFIGGFYVAGASTYTVNSRVYVGINAPGTITVTVKNLVNTTIATFSYVAASSGFFDVTLAAPVAFSAGWYNLTLTAATAGTTAFARGMYLTTV